MAARKPHHHGNLRAALIEAGTKLLAEGGPDALSIRKAAALVGVSHAAPAHHFTTLVEFRSAVLQEGFRQFTETMEAEIRQTGGTPHQDLLAGARGYLRFALNNPSMFQMMFGGAEADWQSAELSEAAMKSYEVLQRICAPLMPSPAGAEGNEILVWSIVHGFASLVLTENKGFRELADPLATLEAIFPSLPMKPGASDT